MVKKVSYEETGGHCPSYLVYLDHAAKDVALAIRGLHMGAESDYLNLLDNRRGQQVRGK